MNEPFYVNGVKYVPENQLRARLAAARAETAVAVAIVRGYAQSTWTQPEISGDRPTKYSCDLCHAECLPDVPLMHKDDCFFSTISTAAKALLDMVEAAKVIADMSCSELLTAGGNIKMNALRDAISKVTQ